jgi:signal transduction histidine kinase
MNVTGSEMEPAAQASPPEMPDFYASTKFWTVARRYGYCDLLVTWGSLLGVLAAAGVLFLYLNHDLPGAGLQALGIAYISLGAALFGIVLAGLAVVGAFFDREYVAALRDAGTLDRALFGFWWVAALAVVSLLCSIALTVVTYTSAPKALAAAAVTVATTLFVATLIEALALVGSVMRHGLYRAEIAARDIRVRRNASDEES